MVVGTDQNTGKAKLSLFYLQGIGVPQKFYGNLPSAQLGAHRWQPSISTVAPSFLPHPVLVFFLKSESLKLFAKHE